MLDVNKLVTEPVSDAISREKAYERFAQASRLVPTVNVDTPEKAKLFVEDKL